MRRTSAMGAAATMFAVLAAVGCSGGSSGGGASSTASHASKSVASGGPVASRSSTVSKSPTSKSSLTTATPKPSGTAAGAPGVPEPARQHTKAGAKAFAAFYFDRLNAMYRAPEAGSLKTLESSDCKICADTDAELYEMRTARQKYDRDQIKYAISTGSLIPGGANVYLTIRQQPAKLLASDGTVVSTTPTPVVKSIAVLSWLNGRGWRVQDVANA